MKRLLLALALLCAPLPALAAGYVGIVPSKPVATPVAGTSTALVVCTGPCALSTFQISADSTLSGADWWVLIYDATSDPGNGTPPSTLRKCFRITSGTAAPGATYGPAAPRFETGIVIVVSSTGCGTETQSNHAFIGADYVPG